MKNFWEKLDGLKTTIGAIISLAGQAAALNPELAGASTVITQVGTAVIGIGLLHKAVKQIRKDNKSKQK